MKTNKKTHNHDLSRLAAFVLLSSLITLAACGGGGGGGSAAVSYDGKTTQAKVTQENAGEVMFEAQSFGEGLNDAALPLKPGERDLSVSPAAQAYGVAQRVQALLLDRDDRFKAGKPVSVNESEPGTCGGSIAVNGSVDEETGDLDLTFQFNQFCEEGATISGVITAKGNARTGFTMTIRGLSVREKSSSVTMEGSIFVESVSLTRSTMIMDVVIRDDTSGKTFKVEDYRVVSASSSVGETISMSGRFFSPDEGFVDLTTPTPLFVASGDVFPSRGVLEARGSDGTQARLTALNSVEYELKVDADGDGTFETTTTGNWADLGTPVGA